MLSLCLATIGCTSSLSKHSAALSTATAPVVDQAATAYRTAQALHDLRVDYDAIPEFEAAQPVYNPRNIQPLMSDKDIQVRLAVLEAFKCYVQSIVAITNGTDSKELDAASKSVGDSLSDLGNSLAPAIESTLGVATAAASTTETTITTTTGNTTSTTSSTSSSPAPPITPEIRNSVSVAVNALGQFLVSRKIKKELPGKVKDMDPHVETLCKLLEQDINTLQSQEQRDYNRIINQQTLFIRETTTLDPQQRRAQIMKLPRTVRQQRASDEQLTDLRASLVRLALTHHALAADAQGNNSESLKGKLADLEAAGDNLGKFYSSLPSQ
ncbi:hypothetical protein H7849_15350 [Alloacidobacterium dinghuense]|uniref:Uncharacterized protein n=1 Tax=Alloacidobacterium dinghuense TaxID=2763107 RepID=A0A7G8BD98_9BACT|nr:hypothetical protein [Alloacidobacterium dinghuense]QNI30518.1 hypothetical protein H7849_15350 [Alloacidobacterium dinghuense]